MGIHGQLIVRRGESPKFCEGILMGAPTDGTNVCAGVNLSIRDLELLLETWASGFYAELDFSREGRMQTRFRDAIVGRIDHCYIPKVYTQYCTRQMLVSEWVSTTRITEGRAEEAQHLLGVSARCFAFQLLELGLFHGDPHAGTIKKSKVVLSRQLSNLKICVGPGNMLRLRGENGLPDRLCLLDFGLVAEIPVDARPGIARATVHAAEGRWSKYIDALIELEILDESLIDRCASPFRQFACLALLHPWIFVYLFPQHPGPDSPPRPFPPWR